MNISLVTWLKSTKLFLTATAQALTLADKLQAKTNLDLQNVDNTSDASKPVSTAAQTALDLKFNKAGDTLTGTAGAGYSGFIPQSSAPSTPASGFRLYADSAGKLAWKGANGYVRTFDGTANTADRVYTLPDTAGTIALAGESYPRYTWAGKPAASSNSGKRITITDFPAGEVNFYSNGTRWLAIGGEFTYYVRNSQVAIGATTSETTVDTVNIPADLLGPNGGIKTEQAWTGSGSGAKTPRIRLVNTSGSAWFAVSLGTYPSSTTFTRINNTATGAQKGVSTGGFGVGNLNAGGSFTTAIDTTAAFDVLFTGAKANSGDSMAQEYLEIRIRTAA